MLLFIGVWWVEVLMMCLKILEAKRVFQIIPVPLSVPIFLFRFTPQVLVGALFCRVAYEA